MPVFQDEKEMTDFMDGIKAKVSIDPLDLASNCRDQPLLVVEVGEVLCECRAEVKQLKDILELTKAEISSDVRANPKKYRLEKVTEGSISETVLCDEEMINAKEVLREAEEYADNLGILMSAVEQRKAMLKDMVTLFVHQYYSEVDGMKVDSQAALKIREQQIIDRRRQKAGKKDSNA